MKRLYVSDLDGTLLNRNAELSEVTIRVVNQAIEQGLNFTVSTARTPTTALKIVEPLNLKLPVMLMNGVLVYDMAGKQYIRKEVITEETVMVLLGLIPNNGNKTAEQCI